VGYLEAMAEGLTIDLITVSLHRVGDSQAPVPQRLEPERVQSPRGRTPPPLHGQGEQLFDGADAFLDSIDAAKETEPG
jgi:hypothetical protein